MQPRQPVPAALHTLALLQDGVVTREQALGLGLSRHAITRLANRDSWLRLTAGVYQTLPGAPTWPAVAWAGVLIGGDRARVAGQAAATLCGLREAPPDIVEILVPAGGGCPRLTGPWSFRRETPGARLPRSVGSPPRITVEDLVLDLAAEASDVRPGIGWVTQAVQARLTTPARIRQAMAARHFQRHRKVLLQLLEDVAAGVRSTLELSYLRDVERAHGLPIGARQRGRRGTECDVWYEEYGLLVELDGRLGHQGMGRFRDMHRDNAATTDGLATLRYGSGDVLGIPCQVAMEVARNLELRGWTGMFSHCPRCWRAA
jgi:hypothetical protein